MNILSQIFAKRGIKDIQELDAEEAEVFQNYEKILSKPELSLEDIKHFLETQISVIESKWKDYETKNKADLIPYHTCYKALLNVINAPQAERKALEDYLTQLHNL